MDDGILLEAIKGELGNFETLVSLPFGLALAAGWAGFNASDEVSLLTLKLDRRRAFWAVVMAFVAINLGVLLLLLRLGDLIRLIGPSPKALTLLASHDWALNPFAAHGQAGAALFHDYFGLMALALVWWSVVAAAFLVRPEREVSAWDVWTLVFSAMGLVLTGALLRLSCAIGAVSGPCWPDYAETFCPRFALGLAGVGLGIALLLWVIRRRNALRAASRA